MGGLGSIGARQAQRTANENPDNEEIPNDESGQKEK